MIAAQELMPYQNPYFGQVANPATRANAADGAAFVALGPGESRTALVRRLLSRYDAGPNKDNKLSRSEIGLDQATFGAPTATRTAASTPTSWPTSSPSPRRAWS